MRKGLYILPSLFTVGNLGAGFFSVISSINYNFTAAAWSIFLALVLDILDGRIARWTHMDSRFGIELDSLADLISFGMAPAILMYQLVLKDWGKPGIIVALIFVVAGALRLARFNLKTQEGDLSNYYYFSGLPIPAGASLLASFVLLYEMFEQEITYKTMPLLMNRMPLMVKLIPLVMLVLSYLMVSNLRYSSFKKMKLTRRKSLQTTVLVVITILLIVAYPQNTLFIIITSYVFSGIGDYILRFYRLRRLEGRKNDE